LDRQNNEMKILVIPLKTIININNYVNQINNNNKNIPNNFVKPILNKANDNNFAFSFRKGISNEIPNHININNFHRNL